MRFFTNLIITIRITEKDDHKMMQMQLVLDENSYK